MHTILIDLFAEIFHLAFLNGKLLIGFYFCTIADSISNTQKVVVFSNTNIDGCCFIFTGLYFFIIWSFVRNFRLLFFCGTCCLTRQNIRKTFVKLHKSIFLRNKFCFEVRRKIRCAIFCAISEVFSNKTCFMKRSIGVSEKLVSAQLCFLSSDRANVATSTDFVATLIQFCEHQLHLRV